MSCVNKFQDFMSCETRKNNFQKEQFPVEKLRVQLDVFITANLSSSSSNAG
jgi:hypothetical protein